MNLLVPLATVAVLGVYHGVNPGMGWVLAVARGMERGRRAAVLGALLPIAVGHEASLLVVVGVLVVFQSLVSPVLLHLVAALLLVTLAVHRLAFGGAHDRALPAPAAGAGAASLAGWSFLLSSAHGAGLLLVPVLLAMPVSAGTDISAAGPLVPWQALLAASVHTVAMVVAMAATALAVYTGAGRFRGLGAVFSRGWAVALVVAAVVALVS